MHAALLIDERLQELQFGFGKMDRHARYAQCAHSLSFFLANSKRYFAAALRALTAGCRSSTSSGAWFGPLYSSSLAMSNSTIRRPLYLPSPVTQFNRPSLNTWGAGSTSVSGILSTSDA